MVATLDQSWWVHIRKRWDFFEAMSASKMNQVALLYYPITLQQNQKNNTPFHLKPHIIIRILPLKLPQYLSTILTNLKCRHRLTQKPSPPPSANAPKTKVSVWCSRPSAMTLGRFGVSKSYFHWWTSMSTSRKKSTLRSYGIVFA